MAKRPKGKYAWTAKIGEKGQLVIPKEARDIFGIEPGDSVLILGDIKRGLAIVNSERLLKIADTVFDTKPIDPPDATTDR
ncbi:AbrB/MazE/SpoVT family DNA-binding domain-containing protein [Actinomyces minihominis]|uniref:AbrB/MazE/SpoVT family DNA-binding domain-containing protein n=1 Tax=Actinomyces minihominis TaxID=2002838 RepID=UPI000C068A43|nr:AbrB/MazE/SpoVT family DNA-binding domain-containing protein [Actinomyces minihominis]